MNVTNSMALPDEKASPISVQVGIDVVPANKSTSPLEISVPRLGVHHAAFRQVVH